MGNKQKQRTEKGSTNIATRSKSLAEHMKIAFDLPIEVALFFTHLSVFFMIKRKFMYTCIFKISFTEL